MSNLTMLDVFRQEVESQITILSQGLQSLENQPQTSQVMESLARAAYMIEGTGRLLEIEPIVNLAHHIQECLNQASKQKFTLNRQHLRVLLEGVDSILTISQQKEESLNNWLSENRQNIEIITNSISTLLTADPASISPSRVVWKNVDATDEASTGELKPEIPVVSVKVAAAQSNQSTQPTTVVAAVPPPAETPPPPVAPPVVAPVVVPESPQPQQTTAVVDPQPSSGGQEMS